MILDWAATSPPLLRQHYEQYRQPLNAGGPWPYRTAERCVYTANQAIRCLIFEPHSAAQTAPPQAAIVYCHGGAWVVGSPESHSRLTRTLAVLTGLPVISVDYRLAPEHSYPAAVDDTLAVARATAAGSLLPTVQHVILAGDSAGAWLVFDAVLQTRAGINFAGCIGFYGAYGLEHTASIKRFGSADNGLDQRCVTAMYGRFFGDRAAIDLPAQVTRTAHDWPPCYVMVGDHDPLLDDSRALAAALRSRNAAPVFALVPGATHGFLHFAHEDDTARRALRAAAGWVRQIINP